MSQTIGVLDENRLMLIPPEFWGKHEFSFYLHDQMLHMLIQYEASGAHNIVHDAFLEAIQGREEEFYGVNILALLKDKGLEEPYRHHIISHVIVALTADMLHFLFEALLSFEKRKFSVGFTLLRKALKEHLFYLTWVMADEADFISRFECKNYESLNGVSKNRRVELLSKAIEELATKELFDAEVIWAMIYSKNHSNGFEPTWQRATHLVTSMGDLLKTEDYTLNFIFEDPTDDSYYEFLYSKLPYILIYAMQLSLELFNKIRAVNEKTYSHLVLTTMGCYEALFLDGKSQRISRMLNSKMGDFLTCLYCDSRLKITKREAPRVYLTEQLLCKNCGLESQVPLYWLFSKAKISILRDDK